MQQSQPPIRNLIYYALCTFGLLIAYQYVKAKWYPQPEVVWPFARYPKHDQATLLARLAAAPTDHGLGGLLNLAGQYELGMVAAKKPEPRWPYENSPRPEQDAAIARMVASQLVPGGVADVARLAEAVVLNKQVIARHGQVGRPEEESTLGGDDEPISATLTTMGGGVRELVLNKFDAADHYGLRPPPNPDGSAKKVVLLPRRNGEVPAFAVFHYAKPDDDDKERPFDTLGRLRWTVEKKDLPREISFSADVPEFGVKIIKTFTLAKGDYHLGLSVRIERTGPGNGLKFRYQLAGGHKLPVEGEWYATTFRSAFIGLLSKTGVLSRLSVDNQSISKPGGTERYRRDDKRLLYAALTVQYFASVISVDDRAADGSPLPTDKTNFLEFVRVTTEETPNQVDRAYDDITVRAIVEPIDPAAGAPVEHRYVLYHGPIKVNQLKRLDVDPTLVERYETTLHLDSLTDYGTFGYLTTAIVFFTNRIHWLIGFLTKFLPSGIAIIVVTIIVRACMFPISKRQAAQMQRTQEKMQKIAPEMKEIEKKYKDDFLMKQQAQRELHRKHGINPAAGLAGCLMIFLQMPIFMGLYYALQESVFFRLEPFTFFKWDSYVWIPNLAAPDMLIWWGEKIPWLTMPDNRGAIYYLGPYFNLLPLLGASLIFVQQKLSMPAQMSDEQRQQFTMMKFMTVFMVLMFYKVPAGLSLYFICSSLWGLTERKLVKKMIAREAERPKAKDATKSKAPPRAPGRLRLWWENLLREASKK